MFCFFFLQRPWLIAAACGPTPSCSLASFGGSPPRRRCSLSPLSPRGAVVKTRAQTLSAVPDRTTQKRARARGRMGARGKKKKKKRGAAASSFFFSNLDRASSRTLFRTHSLSLSLPNSRTQPPPPHPPPNPRSGAALIPVVFLAGLFAAVFFRQAWGALVIALLAAATAAPAGGISQRFRHARVWDCWRRYFNLRAAVPEIPYVDPNRRYIVVQTPHSVFPMG